MAHGLRRAGTENGILEQAHPGEVMFCFEFQAQMHQLPHFIRSFTPDILGQMYDVLGNFWSHPDMQPAEATRQFAAIVFGSVSLAVLRRSTDLSHSFVLPRQ